MIRKRVRRLLCFLLCICMMTGLFASCGKTRAAETPEITSVPNKEKKEDPNDPQPKDIVVKEPGKDNGGFLLTGNYTTDYIDLSIPEAIRNAEISIKETAKLFSVPTDSSFTLKTSAATTEDEIISCVHILPETKYSVNRQSDTVFEIVPESKLTGDSVYRVVLGETEKPYKSFVFQTETEVSVTGLYPADLSISVPTNTGIEMTFSEVVDSEIRLSDYFQLSPSVSGEYRRYPDGKTIVFIPDQELSQNTVYKITVKAGLKGSSGRTLASDKTAEFRTTFDNSMDTRKVSLYLPYQQLTLTPTEQPAIPFQLYYQKQLNPVLDPVSAEIYAYGSTLDAVAAMKEYEKTKQDTIFDTDGYRFQTDGLHLVNSLSVEAEVPDPYGMGGLYLPSLKEGAYLINLSFHGSCDNVEFKEERQILLQITSLQVYTESSAGKLLFFVTKNGTEIVNKADITADFFRREKCFNTDSFTTRTAQTGEDGVVILSLKDENAAFAVITTGSESCYVCASAYGEKTEQEYLSYVYTDRSIYFSDDTANFYGILRKMNGTEPLPTTLFLETYRGGNRTPVTVLPDGTFLGSVKIESCQGYSLPFRLCLPDGTCVVSSYLRITMDEKPLYKVSLSFDRLFYHRNDEMKLTVTSTFYDGTPVPGLRFELSVSDFAPSQNILVTGEDGTASASIKTGLLHQYSTSPANIYASINLIGEELQSLYADTSVLYFQSDRFFSVEQIYKGEQESSFTEVRINRRDTSALRTIEDFSYRIFPENTIGEGLNENVSVTLQKIIFLKEQTGTDYDPISKITTPRYRYYSETQEVKSYTAATKDGLLKLPHVKKDNSFDGYYQYSIDYTDPSTGLTYHQTSFANEGELRWYKETQASYGIKSTEGPFSFGDKVECQLTYADKAVTDIPVLYTVYTDDFLTYFVAKDGFYPLSFMTEMMLGAQVCATMSGKDGIQKLSDTRLSFDFEKNSTLSLKVETEKDTYHPGDEASVILRLFDKDGKPVSGTCLFSVVDEACFTLSEQEINPLSFFKQSQRYWFPVLRDSQFSCLGGTSDFYLTNGMRLSDSFALEESVAVDVDKSASTETGNGGDGGAEVAVRENFADNPVFLPVAIGSDGAAKYTFRVPDNITSFRLSAVAVESGEADYKNIRFGSCVSGVTVTLPFFVSAEASKTFLKGDDIVVSARVYGTELDRNTNVRYLFEIIDEAGQILSNYETRALSGEQTFANFKKQPEGTYFITVKAFVNGYSDGVKLPVAVVEDGCMVNIRKELTIDQLKNIKPLLYPVTLSFYDGAFDRYTQAIGSLYSGYTKRYDSMAAYYIAAMCSEKLFSNENGFANECEEIKRKISETSGLLPVMLFGEESYTLSAKVAAVAPECLTDAKKEELISIFSDYLQNETYDNDENFTAALLGLAALKQPVLSELYYAAEHAGDFSLTAKLLLTAAFAYIGDYQTAGEIYDALASEYRKETEREELYFAGTSTEESIKYTAYALLSASLIRKADAEKLFSYLSTRNSLLDLYCLEKAAFVRYYYPVEAKETSFTYSFADKTEKVILKPGQVFRLTLTKSDFAQLSVTSNEENLRVYAGYTGSITEASEGEKKLDSASIEKKITVYDEAKGIYKVSISYRITTDQDYTTFRLSDRLPSGTRFLREIYESDEYGEKGVYHGAYLQNLGQNMQGYVYVWNYSEDKLSGLSEKTVTGQISYLIRGAAEGEFVLDSTVLSDVQSGAYFLTEKTMLEVKDKKITVK